jgi:hypothetical protein
MRVSLGAAAEFSESINFIATIIYVNNLSLASPPCQ